jgi:cobalt/nickel transport protein
MCATAPGALKTATTDDRPRKRCKAIGKRIHVSKEHWIKKIMENRPASAAAALIGLMLGGLGALGPAFAHFQELIPTPDLITADGPRTVSLKAEFTHPFAGGPVMDMEPPARFGVLAAGTVTDLTAQLKPWPVEGRRAFRAAHTPLAPGDYVYFLAPAPYWEPAEGKMIVHYTKVVVDAFGAGHGWDALVGLPVEIEPLVRPYGLWTGNVFRGIVRHNGVPVPFAAVEVEWRNDGSVVAPADPFITQVVKTDAGGAFTYAMPRAGWWGFAALIDGPQMRGPEGDEVESELGGLIWVRTVDMKPSKPGTGPD